MNAPLSLAASQIQRIASLCDFLENPHLVAAAYAASPVTMPPTVGSMGFDEPLWIGLGMVGLWAALDAFIERSKPRSSKCSVCKRTGCLAGRLVHHGLVTQPSLLRPFEELEDMRHLFAHNFSGYADAAYKLKDRHVLGGVAPVLLTCGLTFDGMQLSLGATALRYYAARAATLLK